MGNKQGQVTQFLDKDGIPIETKFGDNAKNLTMFWQWYGYWSMMLPQGDPNTQLWYFWSECHYIIGDLHYTCIKNILLSIKWPSKFKDNILCDEQHLFRLVWH